MAENTTVTFHFRDSYNKPTTRSFQPRDANPTDAVVEALATTVQAYSALSLVKATVSREVDITAITTAAEAKSSRQKDASITYEKSGLRNSHIGRYTFNLVEPKAALILPNGNIDLADNIWDTLREHFDDGAGIAAVVGDWFVSDGEELIEEVEPVDGFLNKD